MTDHLCIVVAGKGIGLALLRKLIEAAKEQQYRVMVGGIDITNLASIALNEEPGICACWNHPTGRIQNWNMGEILASTPPMSGPKAASSLLALQDNRCSTRRFLADGEDLLIFERVETSICRFNI